MCLVFRCQFASKMGRGHRASEDSIIWRYQRLRHRHLSVLRMGFHHLSGRSFGRGGEGNFPAFRCRSAAQRIRIFHRLCGDEPSGSGDFGDLKSVPTVLISLAMMVAGCVIMLIAANLAIYEVVLLGLFVMASGITVLQVAANPLSAALGSPERSHFRLTFSQAFNSLGTFIGPYLGASLFLKGLEVKEGTMITPTVRAASLHGIDRAFFWIAGLIILIGILIFTGRKLISAAAPPPPHESADVGIGTAIGEALSSPWALLGGAAIFLYVGAEVAIGTQMALFLNSTHVWNVPLETAGKFVSLYWGGAMVGRLVGSACSQGCQRRDCWPHLPRPRAHCACSCSASAEVHPAMPRSRSVSSTQSCSRSSSPSRSSGRQPPKRRRRVSFAFRLSAELPSRRSPGSYHSTQATRLHSSFPRSATPSFACSRSVRIERAPVCVTNRRRRRSIDGFTHNEICGRVNMKCLAGEHRRQLLPISMRRYARATSGQLR